MNELPPTTYQLNSLTNGANNPFGAKMGLPARIFGCRHERRLSRPFTESGVAYRVCLKCGARRAFDTKTFETYGPYYFPPATPFGVSFRNGNL